MIKKLYIRLTITVLGCVSALTFAIDLTANKTNEVSKADIRKEISNKLEEYGRMQNAINDIQKMDNEEFVDNGFSTKEAAERAISLGNDIDTVISDVEKIQKQRKENSENYEATMKQIKAVIVDIKITKKSITDSVTKINLYTKRMVETIARLQETRKYIANTRETLSKLLPTLFVIQNAYTNQAGSVDDLKLLLDGQNSLSDTLTFDDLLKGLSTKLDTILGDLNVAQTRYTQTVKDIHETRKQLKATTLSYQEKIGILEEQRAYLLDFLSLYKGNKVKLDQKINNLFETREQLKQRIAIIVQKIKKGEENKELEGNKAYDDFIAKKDDREKRPNMFSWPTLPVNTIKTFFGDKIKVGDKEEVFEGIQIQAEQGQEIFAPADGLVYYMQDQDSIGTNRLVILHKNGYISVFTNLQKILVKTQDVVGRGQLIGLVGGQPGTRGAGWFSNGSMVTMKLYKNGNPIDPLLLTDLSVLNSPSMVPEKYQVKYDIDMRTRSSVIDFSETKFMVGNTTRERRLKFLQTVAAGPYDDVVLRESAAEGTNVDVDLGICIGYAETSMGRHFASNNNIGNVGNNDRGDRVDKDSPLDGAKAIYDTLNNRYLGHYHTIYQLSGYGNKDGAIYASSEYNWQKNVSRCLSTIKGYIVPEDFPFRTYGDLVD